MDLATIIGLGLGFFLLISEAGRGGNYKTFMEVSAMMIIFGGCISALLTAFPLKHVFTLPKVLKKAFFAHARPHREIIADLVKYAEIARRDGILSLESMTETIQDKFIVKGIQMAVDGTDPELIQQILEGELESEHERHANGRSMLEVIGKYAPAYGIIGTVIGLVLMLSQMEDASKIGEGMAVAFLATLYGAITANVICLPIADKLRLRGKEEMLTKQIIIRGIMSIQSGDNPRIVEQKLKTFLSPGDRESMEPKGE
jgi:chemotaxis protein MotA